MYPRELLDHLHRKLAEPRDYASTRERFAALQGYGLLPRGRENAGRRLEDEQIASAVLGFAAIRPAWAGQVSLVLGGLKPVGGAKASFRGASDLKTAIAEIFAGDEPIKCLVNVTLSIIRGEHDDEYFGQIKFREDDSLRAASYISKYAVSLGREGSEATFDEASELTPTARQLLLGRDFFRELCWSVELSRKLDLPLKTDWREYETQEEKDAFHKRMGAVRGSKFLNIGVETQVTWPSEPTRVEFGGHHLVLFPKDKDHSNSISVDLAAQRLDHAAARTLINRFLSLLSWCDDQHAILRDGWSGNPVPVRVPRRDLAFVTTHHWAFRRSIPPDQRLLKCLARYREGLNANEAGLVTFGILSFFKVFEDEKVGKDVESWVTREFEAATRAVSPDSLREFHRDRGSVDTAKYVYKNCRVATAHAAKDVPSDADASPEIGRLWNAAPILRALARHYIRTSFSLSESYFTDKIS